MKSATQQKSPKVPRVRLKKISLLYEKPVPAIKLCLKRNLNPMNL